MGRMRLWDYQQREVEKSRVKRVLIAHTKGTTGVALSPDGKVLATGGLDGAMRLWDAVTGELKVTLTKSGYMVNSVAFSPDGTTVASTSGGWGDNTVHLWDAVTGELTGTLTGHEDVINSVTFSPDSSVLATGSWDGTIRLWDAVTGEHKGDAHWIHERRQKCRVQSGGEGTCHWR